MRRIYVAVIEKGEDGFGVFFPDLPGCTSWGATIEEAAANSLVAAQAHVAIAAEHDEELAMPRPIGEVEVGPDVQEVQRLLVPVEVADARVRVNITLPGSVLAALDAVAQLRGIDRSSMIAELVRIYSAPQATPVGPTYPSVGLVPWHFEAKTPHHVGAVAAGDPFYIYDTNDPGVVTRYENAPRVMTRYEIGPKELIGPVYLGVSGHEGEPYPIKEGTMGRAAASGRKSGSKAKAKR